MTNSCVTPPRSKSSCLPHCSTLCRGGSKMSSKTLKQVTQFIGMRLDLLKVLATLSPLRVMYIIMLDWFSQATVAGIHICVTAAACDILLGMLELWAFQKWRISPLPKLKFKDYKISLSQLSELKHWPPKVEDVLKRKSPIGSVAPWWGIHMAERGPPV